MCGRLDVARNAMPTAAFEESGCSENKVTAHVGRVGCRTLTTTFLTRFGGQKNHSAAALRHTAFFP